MEAMALTSKSLLSKTPAVVGWAPASIAAAAGVEFRRRVGQGVAKTGMDAGNETVNQSKKCF